MSLDWGYTDANGPSTWAEKYPLAAGARQSPVDIDTTLVSSDTSLDDQPLSWNYKSDHCFQIVNTGYGWRVDCNGQGTELKGGPLPSTYRLEQFHCHWGATSDEGSEHTVDGKSYAAELHLVHWNCEKYSSFLEAACQPDGLAVLGVFFEVGDKELDSLNKILAMMPDISLKGQKAETCFELDINSFLPETNTYWTYLGSLTTPPCNESVIWIVFKEPVTVTEEQLNAFRNLKITTEDTEELSEECLLRKNYRPPLPLGNRILRECGSV